MLLRYAIFKSLILFLESKQTGLASLSQNVTLASYSRSISFARYFLLSLNKKYVLFSRVYASENAYNFHRKKAMVITNCYMLAIAFI